MSLRAKLLLSQLPLVLALAVVAAGSLYAAVRFGAAPGEILQENFRSFDAGRGMLHSIDTIDQQVISANLRGESIAAGDLTDSIASFERELRLQESNITEHGERESTEELRRSWESYQGGLAEAADADGLPIYRERSRALRGAVNRILELNRSAMQRKSAGAREQAERIGGALATTAVVAFCLAVLLAGAWLRRILSPVRVLERAVQRLADGDFDARIRVSGTDEIASLSSSFNGMAERLAHYQQSSIGELLDAKNRLESVMDSLAEAVIVYDLDGAPVASNEIASRLVGTELKLGLLAEPLQDAVRNAFETVRDSGEPYEPGSLEAAVEVPGGGMPRWLLTSATPVRTKGDVLSGVTVALRDVSKVRRLEGFHGDLVAAAAHELRTPLTSLHMAVHLCLEQAAGPLTDRQRDLLAAARQDCERLQSVVEELLEMARLESGAARLTRSKLNVADLMKDAVGRHEAQARQAGKGLAIVPGDSLVAIDADSSRLQRVLDNLIENAILHAGEGGRVEVGFESSRGSTKIFVDDTGPGVPVEFRERVFAKFFRVPGTNKQGSGLGLSIVEDIVRAHGGTVGVETSPLGGARFWFTIPVKSKDESSGPRQADGSGSSPPSS
ncbi:MAG: ATP-binding protein [Sandaracinaceae bacterium]